MLSLLARLLLWCVLLAGVTGNAVLSLSGGDTLAALGCGLAAVASGTALAGARLRRRRGVRRPGR